VLESDMFRLDIIKLRRWMRLEVSKRDKCRVRRIRVMRRIETRE
jgi:hypothetical protein